MTIPFKFFTDTLMLSDAVETAELLSEWGEEIVSPSDIEATWAGTRGPKREWWESLRDYFAMILDQARLQAARFEQTGFPEWISADPDSMTSQQRLRTALVMSLLPLDMPVKFQPPKS